jgi:hypothetical protein
MDWPCWTSVDPFSAAFCVLLQVNAKPVLIAFFKLASEEAAGSGERRYGYELHRVRESNLLAL